MARIAKERLDHLLVQRALYPSREQAQRAIMAGEVRVNDRVVDKASTLVMPEATITTAAPPRFVSRGGIKLEGALDHFQIEVQNQVAVDLGASTGGFTDCLLQRGAAKVYAIDVGHGQLAWKIRRDPRVVVLEKINARTMPQGLVPEAVALCVIDVSFISLTLVLPNAFELLTASGTVLALIKPQFELERADVARGGVVRDPAKQAKAVSKIVAFLTAGGHNIVGTTPSVITGTEGNQESFICVRKRLA